MAYWKLSNFCLDYLDGIDYTKTFIIGITILFPTRVVHGVCNK
jgi:hypothetical protein